MGENPTRGNDAGDSGWVTTQVAAESLGVDPRTVRNYIRRGLLKAKIEGEGVEKAYSVDIDSLYALRDARKTSGNKPRKVRGNSAATEDYAELLRDLTTQAIQRSAEAADLRARLQLTERTESTVREERDRLLADLERERRRVEALEAELEALRAPQAPPEASEGAEPRSGTGGDYASAERPQPRVDWPSGSWHTPETDVRGPGEAWDSSQEESREPEERPSWWRRFFGFD